MFGQSKWDASADAQLAVKFYKKAVHSAFKSKEEGRQVYIDVDFISIIVPGDRTSVVDRKATEDDRERFLLHWDKYQSRENKKETGTPLDMLPGMSPADAENYKAYNIETLEQLSGLGEPAIKKIGHKCRDYVARARKFLEGDKYTKELEDKIAVLEQDIQTLKEAKTNESTNNNPKRNKRNGTRRAADDGNRE